MADNQFTTAAAPMAKPSLAQQVIAPDRATQQMQIARNQQLAAYLRSQGLKGANPTEVIGGWAVKQSPIEGLSRLAQALAGQYLQSKTDEEYSQSNKDYSKAMRDYMDAEDAKAAGMSLEQYRALQGGQPQQQAQAQVEQPVMPTPQVSSDAGMTSPVATPNVASAPLVDGAAPSYPAAPRQPAQSAIPPASPPPPANASAQQWKGWRQSQLLRASMYEDMAPGAGKIFLENTAPTTTQRDWAAMGYSPEEAKRALQAKNAVEGKLVVGENKTVYNPLTGQVDFIAPSPSDNRQTFRDPATGELVVGTIKGGTGVITANEAAKIKGQNQNTLAQKEQLVMNSDGTYTPKTVAQIVDQATGGITQGQAPLSLQSISDPTGTQKNSINPNGILLNDKVRNNLFGMESSHNPNAYNPKFGATGLGQIIDSTYKYMIDNGYPKFDRTDPVASAKAANDLMVHYIQKNGGDVRKGAAVYGGFKTEDPTRYVNKFLDGAVSSNQPEAASTKPPGVGEPMGIRAMTDASAKRAGEVYTKLTEANAQAPVMIDALNNIPKYSKGAITGAFADKREFVNNLKTLVPGWDSAMDKQTQTDLFKKTAARLSLSATDTAAATDAMRTMAEAAYPNNKMSKDAANEAASQLKSILVMKLDQQKVLKPHVDSNDYKSVDQKNLDFNKNADPRLWQLNNMTENEQVKFIEKLSKEDAASLLKKRQEIKKLGGLRE